MSADEIFPWYPTAMLALESHHVTDGPHEAIIWSAGLNKGGTLRTDMLIREASLEDIKHLLRLYAQPDFDNGDVLPSEEARAMYARFFDFPDYRIYLAEYNGRVVGSFALLVMLNLGHRGAPSAIIEDVVVDPDMHSRGIGRAMMLEAMDLARAKGCYKLVLSSNASRTRAHRFYESLGFEPHGISFHVTL